MSRESLSNFDLKVLQTEPDGVVEWIKTADGTMLRAMHKGSGTPVILMHDKGVSMITMNLMWRFLSTAGYRVITFDQRGHGESTIGSMGIGSGQMTNDLKDVLTYFDVKDAILVGHSYGAFLSIRLLLDYPITAAKHIKGVISLAGFTGNLTAGFTNNKVFKKLIQAGMINRLLHTRLYSWFFAAAYFGGIPHKDYIRAFLDIFSARPLERLIPIMNSQEVKEYYDRLKDIHTPFALLYGTEDRIDSYNETIHVANHISNMQFKWAEKGTGHMLVWECPAKVVEMVRTLEFQIKAVTT